MPMRRFSRGAAAVAVVAATFTACSSSSKPGSATPTSAATSGSGSKTYSGVVVKVGGFFSTSQFAGADIGAEARFARANSTNELNGAKIDYVGTTNDPFDPASSLTAIRQMVGQEGVEAIVPDLSPFNNGQFLASSQIPYVGYAFDGTYCTTSASQSVWGFGYNGCLVPNDPPYVPDAYANAYKEFSTKLGITHPTVTIISANNQSGEDAAKFGGSSAEGAGFDVVYAKGTVPQTVSDYTPYVQQWMTSANGGQPNVVICLIAAQCISIYPALKAAGFKGYFYSTLGDLAALAKPLAGSYSSALYNPAPSAAYTQMVNDINSFKAGTALTPYSVIPGYLAADMFVSAIQQVEKQGKTLNSTNLQEALDHQTWQDGSLAGPTKYPQSAVSPTPSCGALIQYAADGSGAQVVEPFSCSYKTYPVDPKLG
ncbi:MAG: ABC transporter substrate-binding protein [Actinomycetota bacterium]|nr:ABC transporter substrate-binding protein [Actinomycetota bacterium]